MFWLLIAATLSLCLHNVKYSNVRVCLWLHHSIKYKYSRCLVHHFILISPEFSLTYLVGNFVWIVLPPLKTFTVRGHICGINSEFSPGHQREMPLFGKSFWYGKQYPFLWKRISQFWTFSSLFWIQMQHLRWHLSANLMIQRPSVSTERI